MKENLFTRIFGSGEKKAAEVPVGTRKSETGAGNPTADEIKRNADFWNMVHSNMGKAHLDAGNAIMSSMGHTVPGSTTLPRPLIVLYSNAFKSAVNFAQLLIAEGKYEAMTKKYGTDNLFEIYVYIEGGVR